MIKKYFEIAGVGVEHDELVELAQNYFEDSKPLWEEDEGLVMGNRNMCDMSTSQYTGGIVQVQLVLVKYPGYGGVGGVNEKVLHKSCVTSEVGF